MLFEKKYLKPIPVIVAGSVYIGEDIYKFLQLCVSGVQMATRFVITYEVIASEKFRQAY
jgi:nitronate monooxygenase